MIYYYRARKMGGGQLMFFEKSPSREVIENIIKEKKKLGNPVKFFVVSSEEDLGGEGI